MASPTVLALTGFIIWALALLVVMEVLRTRLVVIGKVAANGFVPDNTNLSPFMQRLARAFANCLEGLPIFGGLMIVALLTDRAALTDGLALVFLGARFVQSMIHLFSTSPRAVSARFIAFAVQMIIGAWWSLRLLLG